MLSQSESKHAIFGDFLSVPWRHAEKYPSQRSELKFLNVFASDEDDREVKTPFLSPLAGIFGENTDGICRKCAFANYVGIYMLLLGNNNKTSMVLFPFLLFILAPAFGAETSSDLVAAESIASDHKAQSVGSGGSAKYGYPYMIAPTLQPQMQARSDDEDKEPLQAKSYGTRNVLTDNDDTELKKNPLKKLKAPYFPIRRQDDEISDERLFRSYREPKYRNFEELEASFLPRRMDINIPYSQYDYSKFGPKLSHSPRDPYLSPSNEPIDSFYPSSPKMKSYSSPSGYGTRNVQPIYGAGNYEDPIDYHAAGLGGGYVGPSSSYASDSDPSYPVPDGSALSYPSSGGSVPGYLSSGGSYGYQDYEIKSNEPIMGNIRKKLLDYAGASDLYEGEPDYLQEIARNKHKYGSIGNDYYAYGGPGYRDSYRDFPYVESKISLIKKSRRV